MTTVDDVRKMVWEFGEGVDSLCEAIDEIGIRLVELEKKINQLEERLK